MLRIHFNHHGKASGRSSIRVSRRNGCSARLRGERSRQEGVTAGSMGSKALLVLKKPFFF